MIPREILNKILQIEICTNRLVNKKLSGFFIVLALACGVSGCSTGVKQPPGLGVRYHNAQYGLNFYLPANWKGHSVLMQEWNAELSSTDYQKVIGTERGAIIVLRNPQWRSNEPCQDIPILVFTRRQWDFARPQRLFVGAGGTEDEISHNAKYVFAINSRHNWGELKGWEETGRIVQQNMAAGEPHIYSDTP